MIDENSNITSSDDIIDACVDTMYNIVDYHATDSDTVNVQDVVQSINNVKCRLEDFLFLTIELDDYLKLIKSEDYQSDKDTYVVLSVHDLSNLTICNSIIPSIWYRYNENDKSSIDIDEYLHASNNEIPLITSLGDIIMIRYRDKKAVKRIIEILYKQKTDLDLSLLRINDSLISLSAQDMTAEKDLVSETIMKNMSSYFENIKKYYNKTTIDTINNINFKFVAN